MRLYRVHPWVDGAGPREPYGPLFIPPGQGYGRWDNPGLYQLRYFSSTPEGAIAETFGSLAQWSDEMFLVPANPRATKVLSTYTLTDAAPFADLADPAVLTELGVARVADVTARHLPRTRRLAARIFESGVWGGITWWSFDHPEITLMATWIDVGLVCEDTAPLTVQDDAVADAANLIVRSIRGAR